MLVKIILDDQSNPCLMNPSRRHALLSKSDHLGMVVLPPSSVPRVTLLIGRNRGSGSCSSSQEACTAHSALSAFFSFFLLFSASAASAAAFSVAVLASLPL